MIFPPRTKGMKKDELISSHRQCKSIISTPASDSSHSILSPDPLMTVTGESGFSFFMMFSPLIDSNELLNKK